MAKIWAEVLVILYKIKLQVVLKFVYNAIKNRPIIT